ncbi:MAG: hypothetical protein N2C12_09330, partial [Planctomycetales bacterium]
VCRDSTSDLDSARLLFNWTVHHIALDPVPGPGEYRSQKPWQSVLFGRGQPIDRGWVFSLLARQQNLDVVFLYDRQSNGNLAFWCMGLLSNCAKGNSDCKIYLFDPAYGIPIPGKQPGSIATLSEVLADDQILHELDQPDAPYPIGPENLKDIAVFIEGGRQYLSKRMKHIQTLLSGDRRIVLTAQPTDIENMLPDIPNLSQPKIWFGSYQSDKNLRAPGTITALNKEMDVYKPILTITSKTSRQLMGGDNNQMGVVEKIADEFVNPLWQGRLQHFSGYYTTQLQESDRRAADAPQGQRGAKNFYLRSRTMIPHQLPTDDNWPIPVIMQIEDYYAKPETKRRAIMMKRDATFWLGLIATREKKYELADYYLTETRKIETSPDWPADAPLRATPISFARIYQANDQPELAISNYLAVSGPEKKEAQFRAHRLAAELNKSLTDFAPADGANTKQPPADDHATPDKATIKVDKPAEPQATKATTDK